MQGRNSDLSGGQELSKLTQKDFDNGSLLKRIIEAVNSVARHASVAAVGKVDPPPPINSIQVQGAYSGNVITAPSEHLHFTVTHTGELNKGVQYIHELSTDPNFRDENTHIIDGGCSRSAFVHLPTYLNDGVTKQEYYLRSYSQYHGSDAQKPTVLGGLASPTKIIMTGNSPSTLLSSTGSGTANTRGQGLGVVLTRPAPGPKRSV
jgi:hypothetical protein